MKVMFTLSISSVKVVRHKNQDLFCGKRHSEVIANAGLCWVVAESFILTVVTTCGMVSRLNESGRLFTAPFR